MQNVLDLLDTDEMEKDYEHLEKFYKSVKQRCENMGSAKENQMIIVELYDKFFKTALSLTVSKLGIVYTPVEVIDFILHSVNDVLRKEFNRSLSDKNIHILDPFVGTGTFITRLLQSGLIKDKDLMRKYQKELHANEIVLLAYYIAAINIENTFHDAAQIEDYLLFEKICLTDTFKMNEVDDEEDITILRGIADPLNQNSARVKEQRKNRIDVIVGNPPYSVGQRSANDNAQNQYYAKLEQRIAETYVAGTKATNKNALYDSYIKAFWWTSDSINDNDGGIIGFVSNTGWLDSSAMDGFRNCLEKEIYLDICI